jgi:hypothetical protein
MVSDLMLMEVPAAWGNRKLLMLMKLAVIVVRREVGAA